MRYQLPVCFMVAASIFLSGSPMAEAASFKNMVANAVGRADTAPISIRDKWALLIGVDTFQDPSVATNKGNANNVENLAATLKEAQAGRFAPDHVQVITGDKATKSGIEEAISGWLVKKALPDDLVLIYISSASIAGPKGEPMLFSFDTLGSEPQLSALDMQWLATELRRRIQSKNIILIVDSSPVGKTAPDFTTLSDLGISVLSATSGNQKSITNGALNLSLFEHHLGEALKHAGGALTLQQIFDHVAHTVAADATTCFNAAQTPILVPASNDLSYTNIVIGTPVKSSSKPSVAFGHPLDQLALSRPDLIVPRNAHAPATAPPGSTIAKKEHPVAAPKPAAADDDDDDDDEDDEKPHKEVDFQAYMTKMKQDIQKNWKPPKGLETRRLVAVFTIMRDGRIVSPQIIEGSGVPGLDKSALDALAAASPLDPLPDGSPRSIDIKYKFDWNVTRQ